MQADAISGGGSIVTGAIRQASQLTGASFQYLLATAQVESNLNPNASAKTSSAGGLFQFLDQTWLSTMKQAGPAFGYGKYANAISATDSGQYVITDPSLRDEIMGLRSDPTANAVMAGAFTRENAAKVAAQIGRPATEGELYMAHFLGANGAAKLIAAASTTPQAPAADLFPGAAAANPAIFNDRQGAPRSASQVYAALLGRFDAARGTPSATTPAPVVASVPDTAAIANAFAAATVGPTSIPVDTGPVFHSLFQSGGDPPQPGNGRRDAVAPLVSRLWAPQNLPLPDTTTGTGAAASSPGRVGNGTSFGLFQTQGTNAGGLFGGGS